MEIYCLYPDNFGANCYILVSESKTGERFAAVIDPSVEASEIIRSLAQHGAVLKYTLLTHGHFDHVSSIDTLRNMTGVPVYIHRDDAEMLADSYKSAYAYFFGYHMKWREADRLLEDGDVLTLGDEEIKVISTPGHSKGSVCFLCNGFLITGDTVFANGFGRTDLHGGNMATLQGSILSLRALDQKLKIYPGHGDPSILGHALDNIMYYF